MPELPEVQTVVNQIKSGLLNAKVDSITPLWPKVFHNFTIEEVKYKLKGKQIVNVNRRAKYIIITLSENIIAIHLRMTGKLYFLKKDETQKKHVTAFLTLENGKRLAFDDVRKFGRIYLYKNLEPINVRHGPEPLENNFTSKTLIRLIRSKKEILRLCSLINQW